MSEGSSRVVRRCPICDGPVASRGENPAFPFCGRRCRQIDLGRWLGGDYVVSRPLSPDAEPGAEPHGGPDAEGGDRDM